MPLLARGKDVAEGKNVLQVRGGAMSTKMVYGNDCNLMVAVRAPGPKTTGLHSGLIGDRIFDIEHHGGDDQAVYAYAREDYDWWARRLGRTLPGGVFGDNLTTVDVEVNGQMISVKPLRPAVLVIERRGKKLTHVCRTGTAFSGHEVS